MEPAKIRTGSDVRDKPKLTDVVKTLRLRLGDTQQRFATRLGLAIATVVRYETTRPPHGEALSRLYRLAVDNQLHDVAGMFRQALLAELGESSDTFTAIRILKKLYELKELVVALCPRDEADAVVAAIAELRVLVGSLDAFAIVNALNADTPSIDEQLRAQGIKETK
jgi:transcriptional regulator with XRE-family HTH domain